MSGATSGVLERRLKSRPITDLAYRGVMNLQIAFTYFEGDFAGTVGAEGLSTTAYNVLSILKGHPEGHPRGEIARRLVYLNVDVTRIVDGLERRGLVHRVRSATDRRVSLTRLTPKGLKVVDKLAKPLADMIDQYGRRLSAKEFGELNRLLEALYVDRLE